MDRATFKLMRQFSPDGLTEMYLEQFKYDFGEKKLKEVVQKVEDSPKINSFIIACLQHNITPTAKEIEILMNTISYFMFSKEETLCLGGLATIVLWQNKWIIHNGFADDNMIEQFGKKVTDICVNLISSCSQNKYNKYDNFFLRFLSKIDRICNESRNS